MKKVVIGLVVAILIVTSIVGILFLNTKGKKQNSENGQVAAGDEYYGNRGNISQVEKVKFLSKNDEYLVGMIGLPVSNEVTNFSNENMIQFALNIAVERYGSMLTEKKNKDGSKAYLVSKEVVNEITNEYFGVNEVPFDEKSNAYYSKANKAFLYGENIEKTLYYYPVDMKEEADTVEITADAIFVSDDQEQSMIENAKYDGKYGQDNVDNTIKFIFNKSGKLVSYQYL